MKIKKIYLLSLLILFILMIGAVSAQDNITENTDETLNETVSLDDDSTQNGDDVDDDEDLYKYLTEVRLSNDHIAKGNDLRFVVATGNYYPNVEIDGKKVAAELIGEDEIDTVFTVSTKGFDIGEHSFYINTTYVNKTVPFWIENIVVQAPQVINLNNQIYGNEFIIQLESGSKDPVSVTIDGETKTYKTDLIVIDLNNIKNTNIKDYIHTITVDYPKGNYHETFNITSTYSIYPVNRYQNIFLYKKSSEFEFMAPDGLIFDKLVATIDGKACKIIDYGYCYELIIPDTLSLGVHVLDITYMGDNKFYKNNYTQNITVVPMIEFIGSQDWLYGEESYVVLRLPENATGFLNVYLNNTFHKSSPVLNGIANITLKNILPGTYYITAKYNGTDYNVGVSGLRKTIDFYYWLFDTTTIDENPTCYLRYIPYELKDNIIVNLEENNYTGNYNGDILEIKTQKVSKIGDYNLKLLYVENGTVLYCNNIFLRVYPSCIVPSKVTNGKETLTVNAKGATGKVTLVASSSHDQYTLNSKLSDGKATFSLEKFNKGTYTIYFLYNFENMVSYSSDYTVKVYNYKLTANALTKYYGSTSSFKVKVTDKNGKLVKSKYVKFYINGKYVKKVKTNKKGIATLKINKAPGSYKVTVKYSKVEIKRNLKVKHSLSLKTVKVKKSAKKLVLTATLKIGKKALKYKKVTFKFNGKTYKAKTNKKGVAKVTIKKSTLKKLKVGKSVVYQAKYLKDTVKKSARVI